MSIPPTKKRKKKAKMVSLEDFPSQLLRLKQARNHLLFFFFLGYRGDVHPLTAKHRQ